MFSVIFDSVEIFDDFICRWGQVILTMLLICRPACSRLKLIKRQINQLKLSQERKECWTSDRSFPIHNMTTHPLLWNKFINIFCILGFFQTTVGLVGLHFVTEYWNSNYTAASSLFIDIWYPPLPSPPQKSRYAW